MAFKTVKPILIDDSNLTSTNVSETEYPEWDGVTNYADSGTYIVQRNHRVWALKVASSTNQDPLLFPSVWEEADTTNAYKMFDPLVPVSDPTTNPDSIVVEVMPSEVVNSVVLQGLAGASAQVVVEDGSNGEVFNETFDLNTRVVANWYDHWWGAFTRKTQVNIFGIPPVLTPIITVTITNAGSTAACGKLIVGNQKELGCTLYGVTGRRKDLSIVTLTSLGRRRVQVGRTIRAREYTLRVPSKDLEYIDQQLGELYGSPTYFSGSELWGFSNIYGILRDSTPTLKGPIYSFITAKVEEI